MAKKNQTNAKQNPEVELLLFENYSHSSFTLTSKTIGHILKNKQKKVVYVHKIIQLILTKMKMKIKSRSHRNDINRPRARHKHSKYERSLSMMMLICIKQHLSNIWDLIYFMKVKQH